MSVLILADVLAHFLASTIVRIKGWLAYRRLYSAAERREHRRQLDGAAVVNERRSEPPRCRPL